MPAAARPRGLPAVAAGLLWAALPPPADGAGLARRRAPARFTVDLDSPPERRWEQVVLAYKDILPPLLEQFEESVGDITLKGHHFEPTSEVNGSTDAEKRMLAEEADVEREEEAKAYRRSAWRSSWWLGYHGLGAEELAELAGIVKAADHEQVTLDRLIAWQLTPETVKWFGLAPRWQKGPGLAFMFADVNGTVTLGQNVDLNFFFVAGGRRMSLEDLAVELTFVRDGTPLFTALSYPGRIGVCAGTTLSQVPASRWSVSCGGPGIPIKGDEAMVVERRWHPVELSVRSALAARLNFSSACKHLRSLPGSDIFRVVGGGPWEGATVTAAGALSGRMQVIGALNQALGKWYVFSNDRHALHSHAEIQLDGSDATASMDFGSLGQERADAASLLSLLRSPQRMARSSVLTWLSAPAIGFQRAYLAEDVVTDDSLRLLNATFLSGK